MKNEVKYSNRYWEKHMYFCLLTVVCYTLVIILHAIICNKRRYYAIASSFGSAAKHFYEKHLKIFLLEITKILQRLWPRTIKSALLILCKVNSFIIAVATITTFRKNYILLYIVAIIIGPSCKIPIFSRNQ